MNNMRLLICLSFTSALLGLASRGALTEGLFIVQNKQREVQKAIQELKKELTACHAMKTDPTAELEVYHCVLRQLIYPGYIDELNRVIAYQENQAKQLEREDVSCQFLATTVKRSQQLLEKIRIERELLQKIFEVDRIQKTLKAQEQFPRKQVERTALQEQLTREKRWVDTLKKRLREINSDLFEGQLLQEVFIDTLTYYDS